MPRGRSRADQPGSGFSARPCCERSMPPLPRPCVSARPMAVGAALSPLPPRRLVLVLLDRPARLLDGARRESRTTSRRRPPRASAPIGRGCVVSWVRGIGSGPLPACPSLPTASPSASPKSMSASTSPHRSGSTGVHTVRSPGGHSDARPLARHGRHLQLRVGHDLRRAEPVGQPLLVAEQPGLVGVVRGGRVR